MKQTQCSKILHHLKTNGGITPKEAERLYGCMRLAARIKDLKRAGYNIETRRKACAGRDNTVAIVAEYHLIDEGKPFPPDMQLSNGGTLPRMVAENVPIAGA